MIERHTTPGSARRVKSKVDGSYGNYARKKDEP